MASGTWRGDSSAQGGPQATDEIVIGFGTGHDGDEQKKLPEPALSFVLEVHHEAVGDLRKAFDDGVEVARAEAHAAVLSVSSAR